ncbi:MAG TPA: hypothetical protein VJP85_01675, partial [Candidatus Baltobacteraceae bacterium]|nr:hypothetical protein [Candidatus Baltobacteraceae bacterium]
MCLSDLHLHTTASDGEPNLQDVYGYVRRSDIALFSITDRDLPQWIDVPDDLRAAYVPGVCVSAQFEGRRVDILVYGNIDPHAPLVEALAKQRARRTQRVEETVFRLVAAGVVTTIHEVRQAAGPQCQSFSRMHVVKAMIRSGSLPSVSEAFRRFLAPKMPAYVPMERLPARDVVNMAHAAGAIAIASCARPGPGDLASLQRLCAIGIDGIETRTPSIPLT